MSHVENIFFWIKGGGGISEVWREEGDPWIKMYLALFLWSFWLHKAKTREKEDFSLSAFLR